MSHSYKSQRTQKSLREDGTIFLMATGGRQHQGTRCSGSLDAEQWQARRAGDQAECCAQLTRTLQKVSGREGDREHQKGQPDSGGN